MSEIHFYFLLQIQPLKKDHFYCSCNFICLYRQCTCQQTNQTDQRSSDFAHFTHPLYVRFIILLDPNYFTIETEKTLEKNLKFFDFAQTEVNTETALQQSNSQTS